MMKLWETYQTKKAAANRSECTFRAFWKLAGSLIVGWRTEYEVPRKSSTQARTQSDNYTGFDN